MRKRLLFTVFMLLCGVIVVQAQRRYVAEDGTGNGTTWSEASNDLQAMIEELAVTGGGEVWVKSGVYTPIFTPRVAKQDAAGNETTNRDKAFRLRKNVKIYGGFSGTETSLNQRDWKVNETVLSGAMNQTDTTYHIVIGVGDIGTSARLDGFTIKETRAYYTNDERTPIAEDHPFKQAVTIDGVDTWRRTFGAIGLLNVSAISLDNLFFTNNIAVGISCISGSNTKLKLNNSVFEKTEGSNVIQLIQACAADFKKVEIKDNNSGGLNFITGKINISNSIVTNNSGRGVAIAQAEAYLDNMEVNNNKGGGISGSQLDSKSVFSNLQITENKISTNGAGIILSKSDILLQDIVIDGNEAGTYAGGLYLNGSSPVLKRITISNNKAATEGGGLHTYGSTASPQLYNVTVKGNIAGGTMGGGILFNGGPVTAVNLLVCDNILTGTNGEGAAIFARVPGTITITNATIVNNSTNSAKTGGITSDNEMVFRNSIIWGNIKNAGTTKEQSNIHQNNLSFPKLNCLIEGLNLTGSNNGLDGTSTGFITSDKIFADYRNGDYQLSTLRTNPVINKGDNSFVPASNTKDVAGQSRFIGTVDFGAYESQIVDDPFEGGVLNSDNEREFAYSGSPVELTVKSNFGVTTYSWINKDNVLETGNGLPQNTGVYSVTASHATGEFSTVVRINRARLTIRFEEMPLMETTDGEHQLVATTTPQTTGNIEYVITEGSSVSLANGKVTPLATGTTVITASLIDDSNYSYEPVSRSVFVQDDEELDSTVLGVRVNGIDATFAGGEYSVTIPFAATATIEVIPNSSKATFDENSERGQKPITFGGENTFSGKVLAYSGSASTEYILKVTVENNDASLSILKVNGLPALEAGGSYKVTIPYSDNIELVAIPTDGNAIVSGGVTQQLANLVPGANQHAVSVTSQDKTVSTIYPVEIYLQSNNAYLDVVTVDGVNATETVTETGGIVEVAYALTVAYTEKVNIQATALHTAAVVTGKTGEQNIQEGENQLAIAVTAEDGTIMNYVLNVTVQEKDRSNDASIADIKVNGTLAVWDGTEYNVNVTSSSVNIEVATNDANAIVSGAGQKLVSNGMTQTFTITVTAEDGTVNSYKLKVTNTRSSGGTDPDPEDPAPIQPVVTIIGQLPEGVTIEPGLGSHTVREGQSLTLTINLGDEYDGMYVFLQIDEEYIPLEPVLRSSVYTYTIENIRENMTIGIHLSETPDPNPDDPTGNLKAETDINIRTTNGQLHIQTGKIGTFKVISINGRIAANGKLSAGETTIYLPQGVYVVVVDDRTTQKIVMSGE